MKCIYWGTVIWEYLAMLPALMRSIIATTTQWHFRLIL